MRKFFQNKRYVTLSVLLGMLLFGVSKACAFSEPIDCSVHDRAIESAIRDQDNKEAFDKCTRGEAETVRDCEKAEQYIKDHFSKHPEGPKMLNRVFLIRYSNFWEHNYEDWYKSYLNTFD